MNLNTQAQRLNVVKKKEYGSARRAIMYPLRAAGMATALGEPGKGPPGSLLQGERRGKTAHRRSVSVTTGLGLGSN